MLSVSELVVVTDNLRVAIHELVGKTAQLETQLATIMQEVALVRHEERKYVPIKRSRDPRWTVAQEIELVFLRLNLPEPIAGLVAEYTAFRRPLDIVIGDEYDILAYDDTRWVRAQAVRYSDSIGKFCFYWWDKVKTHVKLSSASNRLQPLGVMTGLATHD